MNKAQREQIQARAKVREIQDQPDRATDGGVYKKLRGATEAEIKTVSDNTGWNLLDNIKNVYSKSTKGGPGDIETKSQKLVALWNAQKKLSDAINAEAKAKNIRDTKSADLDDGMSQIRRDQLLEEQRLNAERLDFDANNKFEGAYKMSDEKKQARLLEIQERKRNTYAKAIQKKIDRANALAKDKTIAPMNNNLKEDMTDITTIAAMNMLEKITADKVGDLTIRLNDGGGTFSSPFTVQDNSITNMNGGGAPAVSFENYNYLTNMKRSTLRSE